MRRVLQDRFHDSMLSTDVRSPAVATPLISVIVLNYNGREWLAACLDAVFAQACPVPFEVLLVDNGSDDGSAALAEERYPALRVVRNGENLGFAAGNNRGATAARGRWLMFLNNDTRPEPQWLEHMHGATVAHPEFALFTSRMVFLHNPSVVDSAGDGYVRAGGAFKHGHGADAAAFSTAREVFGACGGAFMIERETFEALGGFDPRFFMVHEDVDLSYRARLQGLRCWYVADAVVGHAGSGSLGTASPTAVFYGQRNLEWTWLKNTPRELLLSSALSHLGYSLAGVAHYVRVGRAAAALQGKWAALSDLRRVLRDRARIQATRTVAISELERLMEPHWLAAKRREKAFTASRPGPRTSDLGPRPSESSASSLQPSASSRRPPTGS
jgi:N-acetylglucosaminyl-diphospho-decaprenol L-rhamnosyltransferase